MKTTTVRALRDAVAKLNPRAQLSNPVMFMVYLSALLTTVLFVLSLFGIADSPSGYIAAIGLVLWATVLFGNFAEAVAEGRGKAQADSLRAAKREVEAAVVAEADVARAAEAASRPPWSASRVATVRPLPEAPSCSPTGSWPAWRPRPATASSTR